jgi:hypothetical protein
MHSLIQYRRADSIASILLHLQAQEDWMGANISSGDFDELCENWYSHVRSRVVASSRHFNEFRFALSDLTMIILACERVYFERSFQNIRAKGVVLLSENDRAALNLARENFAAFIRRFLEFCRAVSDAVGTPIAEICIEIPKPL